MREGISVQMYCTDKPTEVDRYRNRSTGSQQRCRKKSKKSEPQVKNDNPPAQKKTGSGCGGAHVGWGGT